jgi:hypothetical protein
VLYSWGWVLIIFCCIHVTRTHITILKERAVNTG